jgi:hypothetical protein
MFAGPASHLVLPIRWSPRILLRRNLVLQHIRTAFFSLALALAAAAPVFAAGSVNAAASATHTQATAVTSATQAGQVADAMADFGSPPSGEIPILFNDHHVYARPDTLRQGRVLAALVKNGTLLVPLRSMFEQMGATVSYDPATKSVTASKPGAQVQVTLGKNEVIINGESRPLDVPPMMYKGVLLVPVRVISEALGAYVQWVPEQHVVVVRYIPPTPVPTPAPTAPPTPVPTPAPTATPKPAIGFAQGAYVSALTANEFSPNLHDSNAYTGEAGLFLGPLAIVGDVRGDLYRTTRNATDASGSPLTRFNTIDGGSATTPVFQARQTRIDGRLEYEIAKPRIDLAGSYISVWNNYGYPRLTGGGFGLEKLPVFTTPLGVYGSVMYYPQISGTYVVQSGPNAGLSYKQQYRLLTYDVGLDYGYSSIYVVLGYNGDRYTPTQNAPVAQTHAGPYLGLGVRF